MSNFILNYDGDNIST